MLESAIQEFQKRYQLPGIFRVIDWHRGVREFFRPIDRGGQMDTNFVHADESETSLSLLLHPEMVDMNYAVDTEGKSYLPEGHFDKSVIHLVDRAAGRKVKVILPSKLPPHRKVLSGKQNPEPLKKANARWPPF